MSVSSLLYCTGSLRRPRTIIITSPDYANDDATPSDVNREFVTLFTIFNENVAKYLDENIQIFLNTTMNETQKADPNFQESNMKHSINGRLFGNLKGLQMNVNELVRWYVVALGSESDLHTPHWHGQTLMSSGHRMDVINLLPATMVTLDMIPDNPGIWFYHCHVDDHLIAGMSTLYTVSGNVRKRL